jgi:hypothetical protein
LKYAWAFAYVSKIEANTISRVTRPNPEQLPTEAKLLTIFVLDTNDKALTTPIK